MCNLGLVNDTEEDKIQVRLTVKIRNDTSVSTSGEEWFGLGSRYSTTQVWVGQYKLCIRAPVSLVFIHLITPFKCLQLHHSYKKRRARGGLNRGGKWKQLLLIMKLPIYYNLRCTLATLSHWLLQTYWSTDQKLFLRRLWFPSQNHFTQTRFHVGLFSPSQVTIVAVILQNITLGSLFPSYFHLVSDIGFFTSWVWIRIWDLRTGLADETV
jgi:hypothetical protein